MVIGTLIIKTIKDEEVFRNDFSNFTMSNGRIYVQMNGGFFAKLPLQKDKLYKLEITGIPELEGNIMNVTYEDYVFNAGASDYTDKEGVYHTGVCVLSNQLQFMVLPE